MVNRFDLGHMTNHRSVSYPGYREVQLMTWFSCAVVSLVGLWEAEKEHSLKESMTTSVGYNLALRGSQASQSRNRASRGDPLSSQAR